MMFALALALVLGACSGDEADTTTTRVESGPEVVALGEPCSPPGRFAETADGRSAICSATNAEGESLSTPVWRLSGGDVSGGLTEAQKQAVETVRRAVAAHPAGTEWPESDETTLLFISEIGSAANLAAASEFDPQDTFDSLVSGYAGANAVGEEEATAAITGLLLGVVELFGEDAAGSYAAEMLEAAVGSTGG